MKQRLWVPMAVVVALVILVPTTFATGESGTTLYAQLGTNRFPGGSGRGGCIADLQQRARHRAEDPIQGPAGTINAVRLYVDGTCANPGIWVVNRTTTAGPNGPYLEVASNTRHEHDHGQPARCRPHP